MDLGALLITYNNKKAEIKARLEDFRKVWGLDDNLIFSELAFCLCTPQTRAKAADKAVGTLLASGQLLAGNNAEIAQILKSSGVRFHNNKARFICEARQKLSEKGELAIKQKINPDDVQALREWLARNIKGLGYKESSHFLRNIGFGRDIAILDRHIIRNLIKFRVIDCEPKTLTRKKYLDIEARLRKFCQRINLQMDAVDLLLWSEETGEIFK